MDVLKALYYNEISESQAIDYIDIIMDNQEDGQEYDLATAICMNKFEYNAYCFGVPLMVLAQWRYEGWPQVCCETGEKFNYKDYFWMASEYEPNKWGLVKLMVRYNKSEEPKNKDYSKQPFDILNLLYYHKIEKNEVESLYNKLFEDIKEGYYEQYYLDNGKYDIAAIIALDKYEYTAFLQGVPFETLAKWRYEGWPQKCCKTGATFDYKKYYWIATELKGSKWGLIKTDKR